MQITTNIPSHGNGQIQNPDAVPSQGRATIYSRMGNCRWQMRQKEVFFREM